MIPHSSIKSEAAFKFDTLTPTNLKGAPGYTVTLNNAQLTTPIILGQLNSVIANGVVLDIPDTRRFGVSFLAKPNVGNIMTFGNYQIVYNGYVDVQYVGDEETIDLGRIDLKDSRVRRWSVSFDGEAVAVRIDDMDFEFNAVTSEEIDVINILPDGGIIDSLLYWSRPISKFEHINLLGHTIDLEEPFPMVKMSTDELYMYPVEHTITSPDHSLDPNGIGWIPVFSSNELFYSNYGVMRSGGYTDTFPEDVSVIGEVLVTEFLDGSVNTDPLADIVVGGIAPGEHHHPIWRSSLVGSRGGVVINPVANDGEVDEEYDEEAPEPVASFSFWMDPYEGEIVDGVTMADGVVIGADYINGLEYLGDVIEDRFMITINADPTGHTIYPDITNLMLRDSALSQSEARDLYESFFILPSIKTLPDTIAFIEGDIFTIDATWGIVTSG